MSLGRTFVLLFEKIESYLIGLTKIHFPHGSQITYLLFNIMIRIGDCGCALALVEKNL